MSSCVLYEDMEYFHRVVTCHRPFY
jgi:hypothetical protein